MRVASPEAIARLAERGLRQTILDHLNSCARQLAKSYALGFHQGPLALEDRVRLLNSHAFVLRALIAADLVEDLSYALAEAYRPEGCLTPSLPGA